MRDFLLLNRVFGIIDKKVWTKAPRALSEYINQPVKGD
jgi:hypothetical protein